ncbi:NlpC/P60 family protein [Azorhizobium doebereinerae]|uniref:C40 family peptidase n=1 Tax=Azorhizobium doebereinerae TaxID=281091 RepID=UPI00040B8FE8|nr:NlpC/P60 family protein [Azorhizobium doebereinerae]
MAEALPDRRLRAARPDLAAAALQGLVDAPRYAVGEARRIFADVAPLRRQPRPDAMLDTEALYGETVTVYEDDAEGWSWVQLGRDGYVGYMPTIATGPLGPAPTHRVSALRSFLFPGLDIKLPPAATLVTGALLHVRDMRGAFAVTDRGAVPAGHVVPLGTAEPDFVAVAARFLGTPYLWGGCSSLGLDCSGLVQAALGACGVAAPRDSDMQEAMVGTAVDPAGPLQRGDLLFWPGHVAIAEAADTLLHANAHHMAVAREPLVPALARIAAAVGPLRTVRRLGGVDSYLIHRTMAAIVTMAR